MENRVLVGMCSGGDIKAQTVSCLLGLDAQGSIGFTVHVGGYKPHNMNQLVAEAKEAKATHILSIDCDMVFPRDALQKLLAADKDIVGANYLARGQFATQDRPWWVIKFVDENNVPKLVLPQDYPDELFECAAVGLGFTLINMRVFEKLSEPYFETDYTGKTGSQTADFRTEDVVFCEKVRAKGFKVWCEPTIDMGHLGTYNYHGKPHDLSDKPKS